MCVGDIYLPFLLTQKRRYESPSNGDREKEASRVTRIRGNAEHLSRFPPEFRLANQRANCDDSERARELERCLPEAVILGISKLPSAVCLRKPGNRSPLPTSLSLSPLCDNGE